jgi:hypothetical protein
MHLRGGGEVFAILGTLSLVDCKAVSPGLACVLIFCFFTLSDQHFWSCFG